MRSLTNRRLTAVVAATALSITATPSNAMPMMQSGKGVIQQNDFNLLTQAAASQPRLKLTFKSKKLGAERQNRAKAALNDALQQLMKDRKFRDALQARDAAKVGQMLESKSGVKLGTLRFGGDSTILLILAVVLIGAGIF